MKVAYLGPAGTFTEDALRRSGAERRDRAAADADRPRRDPRGRAGRGRARARAVRELDRGLGAQHPRHPRLRRRGGDDRRRARLPRPGPPDRPRAGSSSAEIEAVLSHPQPLAQCARFLRETLPGVERRSVSSTAAAVRMVSESERPWAAIGALLGGRALRLRDPARGDRGRGRQRHPLRLDRPGRDRGRAATGAWKTSLVFSELGEDHPGALVDALQEFSSREVNLSRIESRPLRQGLGRYMFFCDLEGGEGEAAVAEAIAALRDQGRLGADPRLLSRRLSREFTSPSQGVRRIRERYGAGPGLNATYEPINVCTLETRRRAPAEGKGRAARAARGRDPLRAHDDGPPRRDPPGQLRPHPARGPPPQDHPPRRARPRRLDLPVLRLAQVRASPSTTSSPAAAAASRSGRTSSPPAPPATAARATASPARSRCTPQAPEGARADGLHPGCVARRSRPPGSSTYPQLPRTARCRGRVSPVRTSDELMSSVTLSIRPFGGHPFPPSGVLGGRAERDAARESPRYPWAR